MRITRSLVLSILAAAASHGLGVALMPTMLVEDEIARGELVVACQRPLSGERNYYLVTPERVDASPLLQVFGDWLLTVIGSDDSAR